MNSLLGALLLVQVHDDKVEPSLIGTQRGEKEVSCPITRRVLLLLLLSVCIPPNNDEMICRARVIGIAPSSRLLCNKLVLKSVCLISCTFSLFDPSRRFLFFK